MTYSIVARDPEARVTQGLHQAAQISGHRPLRVSHPIRARRRCLALAIAAHVGRHDAEVFRQRWGHLVPHHVGLRIAVYQQKRRPLPARAAMQYDLARLDPPTLEALEHPRDSSPRLPCPGGCPMREHRSDGESKSSKR